ncbi:MAG: NAD(P)H-dependent oxidoreductase subunit E [Brasilonema octagenarum HA4186-MV1]|jgi:(2Fe-2S) ferredoxin|uniref:(2Fe-2S) ferredoxin domain-containing protein n=1 Tax=Brasilonema sennae CENA114 TaxID=415709 RepID=A0A856MDM4_9CYAN|nr:(2Fe-2S) ferredoxin domain-containing protein [Brasilonema sennae]MBW4626808.1 NAD(P)H-dependent oxidoreductase subunit E [Brasilonema octagenarum HA4186-MV1]QDL07801.1 (2Fe-2S) ferredoxin domain-containing protein [Brasilonema sennae CENA114]QDL14162.1 (2Fe-2S) ferredoxin domain-containing protein [Brasilonema octagenarum UFV-E1]
MSKSYKTDVSEFCLEGKFLDFVIKDGYKLKGLRLETTEGECYIKLAKHLRAAFDLRLPPGTRLQVTGEKKFDSKTGEVKLKAQQVMAARTLDKDGEIGRLADADKGVTASPNQPITPAINNAKPKKATILICQKSDCIKRGGKEVCQALEAALSARGLESEVTIKGTGCMKDCKAGPNLVMPDKTRYSRIKAAQVPALMDKYFAANSTNGRRDNGSEVTTSIED